MNKMILTAICVLLLLSIPPASAHPHATVIENGENRCYVLSGALGAIEVEYWLETNGVLDGGEAMGPPGESAGLPVAGVPFWDVGELVMNILGIKPGDVDPTLADTSSGLQRIAFGDVPADTQLTADEFAELCLA
jgi:hypothetical protein